MTEDVKIDYLAGVAPRATDARQDLTDALYGNPLFESDAEKREKARRIARARAAFDIVQNRDADKDDTDEQKWAKALTLAETMLGGGISDDVFLRSWNGGRDFESGQQALDRMRDLMSRPDSGPEREYRETAKLPYEKRLEIAMEDLSLTKKLAHGVGSVAGDIRDAIASGAANGSGSVWAGGAGDASRVKPKTEEEKTAERQAWERQVHDAYMSKLARKARSANISAILSNPVFATGGDANAPKVLRDLLNSSDNAVPAEDEALFLGLSPEAQELIVSARQVMKPDYEGGIMDWLHDLGVTGLNVATSVVAAPYRQGVKVGNLIGNGLFDAGIDVNEISRRRQRLYAATGRFFAGGDAESGALPEMQFERRCEEYGFLPDALIGAVSCLGYMATVSGGGAAGVATMALEGMQQMDDQVAAGGGDIGSLRYLVANAVFGGLYGYTEHLQFGGFLKGWTEEATREAFFGGLLRYMAKHPVKALGKWGVTAFTESVEEGLQRGIQEVNVAFALDKDATKAFTEGFVEDFVSSIPTMFVIGPGGDVVGHVRRSGFALGDEGQANRAVDLAAWRTYDADRNKLIAERKRVAAQRAVARLDEYAAAFETYLKGGIDAVQKKFKLSDERAAEVEDFYKAMEAERNIRDGASKAEFETLADQRAVREDALLKSIRADVLKEIEERNSKNAEGREGRVEKFLSREFWEKYRKAWAKGNALVTIETADGKQRVETDLGAEELVKAGLGRKTAERLSAYFRWERQIGYSAAATERIRELYDTATEHQTTTARRLAASVPEGTVETRDGRTFVKYRVADGADGSRQFGEVEVAEEYLEEWEPAFDEPRLNDAQSIEQATGGEVTAERWMSGEMTADERRDVWENWNGTGLARQGGIELVDTKTGASVSSGTLAQMIAAGEKPSVAARMTVDPSVFEASPLHEYAHGFVAFAVSAGLLSQDEIGRLSRTFGAARGGNELFNEESFADGFRDYLVKRRAGAAVPESEAKAIFEKIYNFGRTVVAEAEKREVERKVAQRAMKAVTDQTLQEGWRKTGEQAVSQKAEKPVSENASGGSENASGANATKVITTDSGHVQKPGMTRSVDPSSPNAFNWMTPTGGKKVSGHLEWVERGDILPIELLPVDASEAVDPENPICQKSIQNRGNHGKANDDKAEAASIAEGATEKGYVAEYAWNDTRTDSGAELCIYVPVEKVWKGDVPEGAKPYVKNGKVLIRLAGYGRDLRLNMLAENHSYNDAYLYKTVGQALDEYGLAMPEDIKPENQPRLIRVVDDMRGTKYSDLVIMSNNAAVSKLDDPSQARQDAELIRAGGFAHLLVFNRDGEVNIGASDEFFSRFDKAVRTKSSSEKLFGADNMTPTPEAVKRAKLAMVAMALNHGDNGQDVLKTVVLNTEGLGIKRQKNAAMLLAPDVAAVESNPDYAIGPDVARAFASFIEYRNDNGQKWRTPEDYFKQDWLIGPPSEIARQIFRKLVDLKRPEHLALVFRKYRDATFGQSAAGDMFARTREEVFQASVEAAEREAAADEARHSFGVKDDLKAEFAADPETRTWTIITSPSDIRTLTPRTLPRVDPVSEATDNTSVVNAMRKLFNSFGKVRNAIDGNDVVFNNQDAGKMLMQSGADMRTFAPQMKRLFETSVLAWEEPPVKMEGHAEHPDVLGYKQYVNKFVDVDGKTKYVRFTVREHKGKDGRRGVHAATVSEVAIYESGNAAATVSAHKSEGSNRVFTDNKIAKFLSKGKGTNDAESRLSIALAQAGEKPGKERMARLEARYSFAAANPLTLTGEDIALAISKWGTTDDINKGIYCLPDGTMLQGKGTVYTFGGRRIEAFGHDGWVDLILENAPKVDTSTLDGLAEAGGQIEAAQRAIARAGAIRISGDKNGFTVSREPTEAQYDALYDMAEKAYLIMEENGDEEMMIDVTDDELRTLFTLTYPRGTSARRIIEDLRGWYERGENPAERERSMLAEFHRWSVAPKGVQKGAAVEYPDASEELRVMSEESADARWSIGGDLSMTLDPKSWGDLGRKVKIVGNGVASWTYTKGTKVSEHKAALESLAYANIEAQPNHEIDPETGNHCLVIDGTRIRISKSGLFHSADRRLQNIGNAIANIGDVMNGSVAVPNATGDYSYRIAETNFGRLEFVLVTLKNVDGKGELVDLKRVYSVNVKASNAAQSTTSTSVSRPTEDIIANFFDAWKELFYDGAVKHLENARDRDYADAVKRGDMETAQRMVREAAAKAMPDTKVVNRSGEIKPVYHGTPNGAFTKFDKERIGETWNADDVGFFFTSSKSLADDYTRPFFKESSADPHLFNVYLNITNPLVIDRKWWQQNFGRSDIYKHDAIEIWDNCQREILDTLKDGSYDGVIVDPNPFGGEPQMYVAFGPEQIKSADPVTYDDAGNVIPLSQRFDQKNPDIRWSIGVRRKAEYRDLFARKRPDIPWEDVEAYLDEIAGYESAKKQKLAVHWIITGAIELPQDAYKLDKAIATAERAKVDPFQYRNPEDIFAAFPQHLPKEKPIDPDTVPELTGKTDMGHGVTVYDVRDDREGQRAMRRIVNTHFGKDASPWCLLQGEGDTGELSDQAWHYWQHYNSLPKKVAFLNGKLLAFMATDKERTVDTDGTFDAFGNDRYVVVDEKIPEQWWDRKDASHDGIPIEGPIPGDALGRSGMRELKDGKFRVVGRLWRGSRQNGKYEEWYNDQKTLEQEFKDGKPVGWRRTYGEWGNITSVEHFDKNSNHDRPQLEFTQDGGLRRFVEYAEGDKPIRIAAFYSDGELMSYNESKDDVLPDRAYWRDNGQNISWKDDSGNFYSVRMLSDGRFWSVVGSKAGSFSTDVIAQNGDEYAALPSEFRAKLEGESAAVLEAMKAEAAAIYREYSPAAGTRWSMSAKGSSLDYVDYLSMLSRKAQAYGDDLVNWMPKLKGWGLTPITRHDLFGAAYAAGQIYQGGGSVPRSERAIDKRTGEMGDWVRGFMRRAKNDAMLAEMESDEFDLKDGVITPRKGARVGEIGRIIRRDIAPVPYETARKTPGFDAYFGLTVRYGLEAQGLAACFKQTEGFYNQIQALKAKVEEERRLGKDKGIAGRPMRLDQMGVNVANEGRVIGATPVEDWVGGEANYSRMHGEILRGVTTARLWEIVDGLKNLPRLAVDDRERKYLERAGRLILATFGNVKEQPIREIAVNAAEEIAKEIVTDDMIARIKKDFELSKAQNVHLVYIHRNTKRSLLANRVADEIARKLTEEEGVFVNTEIHFVLPSVLPGEIDSHPWGYVVTVDDWFSPEISDIPVSVLNAGRSFGNLGVLTYVSAFGTKVGNRFAIPEAELTQLLKDAKISLTKFKEVHGYDIRLLTGPEAREKLRNIHNEWEDSRVLVGSGLVRRTGQPRFGGRLDQSEDRVLGRLSEVRGVSRDAVHGSEEVSRSLPRGNPQFPQALESRLNDDTRWSIASRKLDWDALPDTLDKVVFSTSVQHFTGQDKVPVQYELFKQYRDYGHLDIIRPEVEKWAKSTGPLGWLGLYLKGKYYGDIEAARKVVRHRISNQRVGAVRSVLEPNVPVKWLYVRNDDGKRTNRLPQAYSEALAARFGGAVDDSIVKVSDQRNTSAGMRTRAHREFQFAGEPEKGVQYVIADDVWTTGQTTVSLLDYLVGKGANVRGITTLAVASHGDEIKPPKARLEAVVKKAQFTSVEEANAAVGLDLRKATGSELQAYFTGARANKYGFIDWFDPSANEFGLDFAGRGRAESGLMPPLFSEPERERLDLQRWRERNASQGVFDFLETGRRRDVETAARMSFGARMEDGGAAAAERALVNHVAYLKLTGGGVPRPMTLAKLGLTLGMKTVSAKRILEEAQRVADRAAGTIIEKAARNGDVWTAFTLMEREKEREDELRKIISSGAKAGGDLVLGGVVAQNTLLGKRIEQTMRTMTAADLADMEGDTGLDLAAEILGSDPKAFDDELKPMKPHRGEDQASDDTSTDEDGQPAERTLTDREKWMREEAKKAAAKRVQAFIEAAKKRAEENRKKAEERRAREAAARAAGEEPSGSGEGGEAGEGQPSGASDLNAPEKSVAGFKNKWEFAAFVRKWAEDKYAKTHGMTTFGRSEENRLFANFYRICVQKQLQDLADKLLDPKGARAWVNRRIGELAEGMRPDTIERESADIFAFINRNAIREERVKLIEKFRKEIRQFISGAEFEELKVDSTRRLTGWVEEAARYMMKVCQLSGWAANGGTSQFERERQELLDVINARRKIYDESGKPVEDAEKSDAETVRARWKLNLLEQFGAMAQMMPGEIEDLREDAIRYLTEEAAALEERWKDAKAWQDGKRRALAGAIVGPNGQRYESKMGYFGQLFDALNGMLRLRLKHLVRFAGKKERADAESAINEFVTMLGQGEVAYARAVQRDRAELWKALGRIFRKSDGRLDRKAAVAYIKRMEEPIPVELSRQLSFQGYAERMTYGQMLQLLVSLEQKSYAENVKACGREGQAELIRNSSAFTVEDAKFIEWLRAFYEAKREEISAVTERMVGSKVDSPDPHYCPVKIYRGEMAKDLHIDAGRWNAIDEVLSRRVMHKRDFDESATILGMFYDRSNRMAGLVAWAERGTLIENVICSGAVQQQIGLAFGPHESSVIRRQLEDTFNGGQSRSKTPGEIVMMDKAMNFVTFGYLGFNPLSAIKQTTSFTVWANVLPGGFRELWHHMTHIDREAVRHIMESEEYKVRYGDDTGSGQDYATKALNENSGQNPFMRLMTGPGMWLLKKGDFLPGVWIMQGVYKSLLNKHLNEGMEENAADKLAISEAFDLLEETQQSGRTYNTSELARKHERLGAALVQFATSPLQQLQYETQAFREWMDLKRYGAEPERIAEARAKLIRAAFINHVLLPAALELVVTVVRAITGEEPRWEKDGYAWDLLRDVLLGQASRIFYVGVLASSMMDALFKRQLPRGSQLIPSEGAITIVANVAATAHDVMTLDGEKVKKDLERMAKSLAPTRIPYNLYRRVTGDSDVDRKRKKNAEK